LFLLCLVGCDDSPTGPDFSGAYFDLSQSGDASDLAISNVFCAQTCQSPAACCIVPPDIFGGGGTAMCATSCPDGGFFTQCTGPSECPAETPSCCFSVNLAGDMDGSIMSSGGGATCQGSCPVGLSNNNTVFHTLLCHAPSDCSGYSGDFGAGAELFDGCCTSPRAPGVRFCAPKRLSGSDGLSCN
jgi:hypothetical protein